MTPDQLRSFANRDWDELARLKAEYWVERKRRLGPTEGIRMGDLLRRHVRRIRPDWPTACQRDEDLAHHIRLGKLLRSVDPG